MIGQKLEFYRQQFRLGPLDFDFSAPGIYRILGANGSGKSTLLKLLSRRLKKSRGELLLPRGPIATIGVEPLYPLSWTTSQALRWTQKLSALPVIHKDFLEPIEKYQERRLLELSTGQRRQVELSILLAHAFESYLLDEALENLDSDQRSIYEKRILQRAIEGSRVIFTSHHEGHLSPQGGLSL